MSAMKRWRGLRAMVTDVVEHGSRAIEEVQTTTAKRVFDVLELIPAVKEPAALVHAVHDVAIGGIYASVRVVNQAVGVAADLVIDLIDTSPTSPPQPPSPKGRGGSEK